MVMFREWSFLAREHYIIYTVSGGFWGECIEKRFLFFEHKGTRIFETRKPLFKKKPHIPCFLNYQPILTNKTLLFLHKLTLKAGIWVLTCSPTVSLRALTRNHILSSSNATRCGPAGLIGWDAGSGPARHGCCFALFIGPKVYREKECFFDTLSLPFGCRRWRETQKERSYLTIHY